MTIPLTGSFFVPKEAGQENGPPSRYLQTGSCRALEHIITDLIRTRYVAKNPDFINTSSEFPAPGGTGQSISFLKVP